MAHLDYSKNKTPCQEAVEILHDKSGSGKERPWHLRKLENQYISTAYAEINAAKAERLAACADCLVFRRVAADNAALRLVKANFCRVRLCPICAWRRSLKTHAQMMKILENVDDGYAFLMVTLTVKNVRGEALGKALDDILSGFKRLVKRKAFVEAWEGWYRGVEVTHNLAKDTYHPHIHALVAVKESYFKGRHYITQAELAEAWKGCCRLKYNPVVDVRRVYGKTAKAVAEVAKYTTKSSDIICFDDWDLTVDTVRILDAAFDKRRFIAYGGLFKELHKRLNLDDAEDGDLVTVGDGSEEKTCNEDLLFWWHTGYARYVR